MDLRLMSRVLLSDPRGVIGPRLSQHLVRRGLELAESPEAAEIPTGVSVLVIADLVPALMVQTDPAASASMLPPEKGMTWLEELITAAKSASVERIVLISAPDADGLVAPEVQAAGRRLEAALSASMGARTVVLRAAEVMDPADRGTQGALRAILGGKRALWPASEFVQVLALSDLIAATAAATGTRGVTGKWYDVAAPHTIGRLGLAAEVDRLGRLLTDPGQTEVTARPDYPGVPPLRDGRGAEKALHSKAETSVYTLLAETVQKIAEKARPGARRPPMPRVRHAIETGELPLQGKAVVLTGAGGGIGRAAAEILVRLGANVTGVFHDESAAQEVSTDLSERRDSYARVRARQERLAVEVGHIAGVPASAGDIGRVRSEVADLSDPAEVRRLADRLKKHMGRIDVLINNAAALPAERTETAGGVEMALAVNVVAPVTLTRLLSGPLSAAAKDGGAQVINVVSDAHVDAPFDLDDPMSRWAYVPESVHARTKSALIMLTQALSEVTRASGVRTVSVNPGAVRTKLRETILAGDAGEGGNPQAQRARTQQARAQLLSPALGAEHVLEPLLSEQLSRASGVYVTDGAIAAPAFHTEDRARTAALWKLCADLGGLKP